VFNLASGRVTRIGDSLVYNAYALDGDTFALFNNQPTEVEPISLELTTNLDLVDLMTGERRTAARNLRVSPDSGSLQATNGAIIWQEFKSGGFRTRLMRFDPASNQTSVLVNPLEKEGTEASLIDGDEKRVLMLVSEEQAVFGPVRLELRALEGDPTIVSYFGLFQSVGLLDIRMIGDSIVWIDHDQPTIVVYDIQTRARREVDPFQSYDK